MPDDVPSVPNPVLPGFHPDPAMIHVNGEFLIANSTFQWYPGVVLHRSADLATWTRVPHPLTDLDLAGVPDSGGVWAPDLSCADGVFHLVYTNVASYNVDGFYDTPNFHVSAPSIDGPWSAPVPLHSLGFDPALYHEDGRAYLLSMEWDHRPGKRHFAGIILQEFDLAGRTLTGPVHRIFAGTDRGITEGPHLYRRDGWYYLVVAEGGTGTGHAVVVARSRALLGPYAPDPAGPLLSSDDGPLRKAGHGSFAADDQGIWYIAYLVGRPVTADGRCVLGRETAIQPLSWLDGWPRVPGSRPAATLRTLAPRAERVPRLPDGFGEEALGTDWQTLRRAPDKTWCSLTERPGWLRLRGGQSPASRHGVSLVATRQLWHHSRFEVALDADPEDYQQLAGLIHYYDTGLWHWLHLTREDGVRCLRVLSSDHGRLSAPGDPLPWPDAGPVHLRADVRDAELRFFASADAGDWQRVGPVLDASILSDEYAERAPFPGASPITGFTGAFFGVCATDLTGRAFVCDASAPHLGRL